MDSFLVLLIFIAFMCLIYSSIYYYNEYTNLLNKEILLNNKYTNLLNRDLNLNKFQSVAKFKAFVPDSELNKKSGTTTRPLYEFLELYDYAVKK